MPLSDTLHLRRMGCRRGDSFFPYAAIYRIRASSDDIKRQYDALISISSTENIPASTQGLG